MLNVLKPLIDGGIINEDTQQAINEAWESQLTEAKELIRAEMREEFSQRYAHDKSTMVEALDKMVTESLKSEIETFAEDKQALAKERVEFKRFMREAAEKFNKFLVSKLSEELAELRNDRKTVREAASRMEEYVAKNLSEEISEFQKDKKAVVETKVRLVTEGKKKIAEMQKEFIAKSARLVNETVTSSLKSEMTQLKEDIQLARENMFGRRLFEAFASEFAVTHLNENKEINKLRTIVKIKDRQLEEAKKVISTKDTIVESKDREIRVIKESANRRLTMAELLKPLNKEKAAVMAELLESVQTANLRSAYEKYLPAVLNGNNASVPAQKTRAPLVESRKAVTGDKKSTPASAADDTVDTNVVELKRLAGLK